MRSVNKVILIGNLTRDPELKATASGQSIVTFGIATNRQWTTSTGEKRTSAEYHEVVVWARLAEICHEYLKKGMLVYTEGYLKTRSWDDETGTRRYRTEIVLQDMMRLEKRPDGEYSDMPESESSGFDDTTDDDSMAGGSTSTPEVKAAPAPVAPTAPVESPAPVSAPEAVAPGELTADIDDDNMF